MTSEERAEQVVKDYQEKAETVTQKLRDMHQADYHAFVNKYAEIRSEFMEKAEVSITQLESMKPEHEVQRELKTAMGTIEKGYSEVMGKLQILMGMWKDNKNEMWGIEDGNTDKR